MAAAHRGIISKAFDAAFADNVVKMGWQLGVGHGLAMPGAELYVEFVYLWVTRHTWWGRSRRRARPQIGIGVGAV